MRSDDRVGVLDNRDTYGVPCVHRGNRVAYATDGAPSPAIGMRVYIVMHPWRI